MGDAYQPTPLRILNDGLTVQVNQAPGSRLTIRGRTYEAVQFHFHAPSEHTVYYEYMGSRTMPPYTGSVRWVVLREPISISPAQVAGCREAFAMNARPLQPLIPPE